MSDGTATPQPISVPVQPGEQAFEHPVEPWTADDLEMELPQLRFLLTRLDGLIMDADDGQWPLDVLAKALQELRENAGFLRDVTSALERLVGDRMKGYQQTIQGIGTLERHRDVSRRNWQSDDLLRVVLDSDRRVKSEELGEVESDLDVLKDVYGLKGYNARVGGLKERGIDPSEFCDETDNGRYKVVIR